MIFWRMAWREIRQRPGRSLLTMLSIVIGVASVVAVSLATNSTRQAFDKMFETIAGRAAFEVTAAAGGVFDSQIVETLSNIAGVAVAAPVVQRPMMMTFDGRRTKLMSLGVDPVKDKLVHKYEIVEGQSMLESNGIYLDATFARNQNLKSNDKVQLVTRRGLISANIGGLYVSEGTAATGQGAVMMMTLSAAQYFSKMGTRIDAIQIVLKPGVDEAKMQTAIQAALVPGLCVNRPASRSSSADETSLSTQQAMSMGRAFSLLVAVFVIANTFLINITQRRRQLGIMRAIGATRGQIAGCLYCEAALMGLIGSLGGAVLGVFGAQLLAQGMGTMFETEMPPIQVTGATIGFALAFGLGISFLGAFLPTRRASRLEPVEAMREVLPDEIETASPWLTWLGVACIVVGGSVLTATIIGQVANSNAIWSGVLLLTGFVFLLPMAIGPLSFLTAAATQFLFRVETRIARRQVLRHRVRTALTIGILFVAVSTGIGLASTIVDNVNDVKNWYRKTIVADFVIRAMSPDMSTGLAAQIPDEVDAEIRAISTVKSVDTARLVKVEIGEERVSVVVRDYSPGCEAVFDLVGGSETDLNARLHGGDVVIGSVLSERLGLATGDLLPMSTTTGIQHLKIAGVANDYFAGGRSIYLQRGIGEKILDVSGVDAFVINVDHASLDQARQALELVADKHGLLLESFSDVQDRIDKMMAGVVGGLWALVVLGFIAAAFGVANTLTMNVMEQTRELGLLRIVAMTRWQVRKTVFLQALMLGLMALIPGAVAGVGIAFLINLTTLSKTGHAIQFELHPLLIAGAAVAGLAIVMLAAWLPAERAARMELLKSVKFQ